MENGLISEKTKMENSENKPIKSFKDLRVYENFYQAATNRYSQKTEKFPSQE